MRGSVAKVLRRVAAKFKYDNKGVNQMRREWLRTPRSMRGAKMKRLRELVGAVDEV